MKIDPDVLKYLTGEEFKTNFVFNIEKKEQEAVSREAAILSFLADKNVIHIGCSDHIGIIRDKLKNNMWLHKLITDAAAECIGIDIDEPSIRFIRDELGYKNVYHADILTDEIPEIKQGKWDYAVFGEIIEHLDNPVSFIKAFREKYGQYVSRFIITVPNIYNENVLRNMKEFREVINTDHRFWFTPYTISKVLVSGGFRPESITFANRQPLSKKELVARKLKSFAGISSTYPYYYFKTLIVSGTIS